MCPKNFGRILVVTHLLQFFRSSLKLLQILAPSFQFQVLLPTLKIDHFQTESFFLCHSVGFKSDDNSFRNPKHNFLFCTAVVAAQWLKGQPTSLKY